MSSQPARWILVIADPDEVHSLEVGEGEPVTFPEAGLTLRPTRDRLELTASGSAPETGPVLLNDVQVSGVAELRAGDLLRAGERWIIVQSRPGLSATRPALRWEPLHFELRLQTAVAHAARFGQGVGLLVGCITSGRASLPEDALASAFIPSAEWTLFGARMFAALVPDPDLAVQRERVELWCRDLPHVRTAIVEWPQNGRTVEELWASGMERIWRTPADTSGPAPVVIDPVMVRLSALLDRWANDERPIALWGEPHVGRTLWARELHERSGRRAAGCVVLDGRTVDAPLRITEWPRSGTVIVRHFDALAPAAREEALRGARGGARLVATCSAAPGRDGFSAEVPIPPLRERVSEILPLAMQAVQQARAWTGRAALSLNADARAALQAWAWPGNVLELRTAVLRAALVAESDEIRAENLPPILREYTRAFRRRERDQNLRSSLKEAEKDVLLKVLARTSWNVTAAAKELGLPRRTIVYRMSRLGLRRPGR